MKPLDELEEIPNVIVNRYADGISDEDIEKFKREWNGRHRASQSLESDHEAGQ